MKILLHVEMKKIRIFKGLILVHISGIDADGQDQASDQSDRSNIEDKGLVRSAVARNQPETGVIWGRDECSVLVECKQWTDFQLGQRNLPVTYLRIATASRH